MYPPSNNKILFPIYLGSGETYLSYCIEHYFSSSIIQLVDNKSNTGQFFKTTTNEIASNSLSEYHIIYMIRDGRSAVLSKAKDLNGNIHSLDELNEVIENTLISGQDESNWNTHIHFWYPKAHTFFKYEDFIQNPYPLLNYIEKTLGIAAANPSPIEKYTETTFEDTIRFALKDNEPKDFYPNDWATLLFDRTQLQFFKLYYSNFIKFGYEIEPSLPSSIGEDLFDLLKSKDLYQKHIPVEEASPKSILFVAPKLQMPHNDGIKRYVLELLQAYQEAIPFTNRIKLDVYDGKKVWDINEINLAPYWSINTIKESIGYKVKVFIIKLIKSILKFILSKDYYTNLRLNHKIKKSQRPNRAINKFKKGEIENAGHTSGSSDLENQYDLVHIPLLQEVDFINLYKAKALITIHDLTHITLPQYHTVDNIYLAQSGLEAALKHKASLLTISKFTQQDLMDNNIVDYAVPYIHEAADVRKFYAATKTKDSINLRKKYNLPETGRYYLSLSTLEPRKNLNNAILAFQKIIQDLPDDFYFVIAGKKGWNLKDVLPKNMNDNGKIIFTGFISEEDLGDLYRDAYALVYISHFEGFGLPILEAMSCGKPVIFGQNSSMIEIASQSGIGVDSRNLESIAKAMQELAINKDLYEQLAYNALKESNQYNWFKTGLLTLHYYLNILTKKETNEKKRALNTN